MGNIKGKKKQYNPFRFFFREKNIITSGKKKRKGPDGGKAH
jgi:hypothetical protein